ncbi:MAG: RDD family protein [Flavobacterium sp.]|uniref:RDD family protein n=1 Tax=Flavobacterium sp. TaxID=239 RepID=UPI003263D8E2
MEDNYQPPFEVTDDILASNGQRFLNVVIDYVMRLIIFGIIGFIAGLLSVLFDAPGIVTFFAEMGKLQEFTLGIFLILIYYNVFEAFFSTTVGKLITKTIVVDENGDKPTSHAILLRTICRLIPFDALSFFGSPCRGWHDSLAKTYVVKKEELAIKKELFYSFKEIGKTEEL